MNFLADISPDLIGSIIGFLLTMMVFSYLLGDNGFFRFAVSILVGVSAGLVSVIAWYNIIWPQLIYPLWDGNGMDQMVLLIPLAMSLLLGTKFFPKISKLGSPVVAFLVGVGAATAIGGAVLGTLIPQVRVTIYQIDLPPYDPNSGSSFLLLINGLIFLVGAVSTLVYFQFSAKSEGKSQGVRSIYLEWIAQLGQFFITVALAAIFAGVLLAALAAFVERWRFIYLFIRSFFV